MDHLEDLLELVDASTPEDEVTATQRLDVNRQDWVRILKTEGKKASAGKLQSLIQGRALKTVIKEINDMFKLELEYVMIAKSPRPEAKALLAQSRKKLLANQKDLAIFLKRVTDEDDVFWFRIFTQFIENMDLYIQTTLTPQVDDAACNVCRKRCVVVVFQVIAALDGNPEAYKPMVCEYERIQASHAS